MQCRVQDQLPGEDNARDILQPLRPPPPNPPARLHPEEAVVHACQTNANTTI